MKKLGVYLLLLLTSFSFFSVTPDVKSWTAIGDSITYLNDHLDETGNRVTKGYLTRVTEQLPNIKYNN
ncbi:hypothetical protein [Mucilaginibacter sp.]|uniref:hypothetical protein n=1 Tax=Mucilaginibacter sp. TaxID=1882438 RepID=UPI0025D4261C|nr:hypothetical protein [Mucilaginibacter sp.]